MTGNSLCASVSVKTHRPGIPCRHDGKGIKQGDEGVGYWRRNKHWGGTTVERQLRENGVEACRSNSRHEYASFARFGYLSVCQPFTRYNQIKKDLSSCGRARSGRRKSLFDTTGKAFPDADRASSVHRKSGFRPSENLFSDSSYERNGDMEQQKRHIFRTDSAMPFLFYSFQTVKIFYFSHSLSIHA